MTRLSVNITPATAAALERMAGRECVTVTEALRRLVAAGAVVDEALVAGGRVVVRRRGSGGVETLRVV